MNTLKVSIVATLVALCVTTNYALVGVPNFKAMDFIVFVGGFCFGSFVGAYIGIFSWAVYGVINPYGFVPQVWLVTMFSEAIYGLLGGLLGKNLALTNFNDERFKISVFFGTMGFFLTLIYDLITNVAYASAFGIPIIAAIAFGAPFTILHQVSNAAIFGVVSIPVIVALKKLSGGEWFGIFKK
jgi:uncharacterized membrane protein